jgi:uncharacterized protein YxeA
MKKTLITVIITLLAVALAIFAYNAVWGEGCILLNNEKECSQTMDKKDCSKTEACCDKMKASGHQEKMMAELRPLRAEFETELSEEEKEIIKTKFEGVDHSKMCPDGQKKFMEQNKEDFAALDQIADNHSEYLDALYHKMHKEMGKDCGENKSSAKESDDAVKKVDSGCPEAAKCKEATEKCKGTEEKKKECEGEKEEKKEECKDKVDKECKEANKECQEECMSTFKAHFLLLDY